MDNRYEIRTISPFPSDRTVYCLGGITSTIHALRLLGAQGFDNEGEMGTYDDGRAYWRFTLDDSQSVPDYNESCIIIESRT